MRNGGAAHNSYSAASFLIVGSLQLAVGSKTNNRFMGSRVQRVASWDLWSKAHSKNLRTLSILRTLSNLLVRIIVRCTSLNL